MIALEQRITIELKKGKATEFPQDTVLIGDSWELARSLPRKQSKRWQT